MSPKKKKSPRAAPAAVERPAQRVLGEQASLTLPAPVPTVPAPTVPAPSTSAPSTSAPPTSAPPAPAPLSGDPILRTVSRAAFALVIIFALLLLWRGHSAPGGGFIAGLMTACALILHRIATGENALRVDPARLIPWGAALSFVTGLVPYVLGRPFLKSDYGYLTTALTGEFEWASAMLFDIGVFAVVVGSAMTITGALTEVQPSERVEEDE